MPAVVQTSTLQSFSAVATNGTGTVSLNGTAPGNALILLLPWVDSGTSGAGLSNVSDGTNTWNNPTTFGDSHASINHTSASIYSAYNIAGGNVTVTMTNTAIASASSYWKALLLEVSGLLTAGANDANGNAHASANSTGPMTCSGLTLASASEIAFTVLGVNASSSGAANPTGWTTLGIGGNFPGYGLAYLLTSNTNALSPSYGFLGTGANWTLAMASYKGPSSAPYALADEVWL